MERLQKPVFLTSEDLEEVFERDRHRLGLTHLLHTWDAAQKGYLEGVPTVS